MEPLNGLMTEKGSGSLNRQADRMCLFIIQQSTQTVFEASMRVIKLPLTSSKAKKVLPLRMSR